MRTIKRSVLPLNEKKKKAIQALCYAYSSEKQYWLGVLQNWKFQKLLGSPRKIRDLFLKENYQSRYGLQARHWKLALQDAANTWDSYWQALFIPLRQKINSYAAQEEERHYAYWLLSGYEQFSSLMQGLTPRPTFPIEKATCHRIAAYLRKKIKKLRKRPPCVQKKRRVAFDSNCYRSFENEGRQYLGLMSLDKGKRLILPLLGNKKIDGNLTLIMGKNSLVIHQTEELKPCIRPQGNGIEAIDFGYTEALTDTQGNRYGTELGSLLTQASDVLNEKMKKRNRLHALKKKYRVTNPIKARRLLKYNLGRQKLVSTMNRTKASIACEVNKGINKFVASKNLSLLVTEDLRHTFSYDGPKALNRRLSFWIRGLLQDRIVFKALAKGFRHEQVNPAYGSQTCPSCGFVDKKNRSQDVFRCLYCGHEDHSDRVAALNYASRYGDQEISQYTPYWQVRTILFARFHRRLEAVPAATVPGRTLDTVQRVCPPSFVETVVTIQETSGGQSESETK